MTVTDAMLMAYADGELDAAGRETVEAAVAQNPALADALARHEALRNQFTAAFAPALDEPVPQRLTAAVTTPVQGKPAPALARLWLPLAACLVLGLGVGANLPRTPLIGPDMTAHGVLAKALETQGAGQDQAGKVVRIGITLREKDTGRFCRTFQTSATAGLACRDANAWRVQMAVPEQAQENQAFRTAAGLPPALMSQVETLIDGPPMDAAAEKAALDSRWRR